jgi:glycosyltransferase involved in cell wall biosynthesis
MRVLHFLDSLNRGGAEMQALDVCRNASRFGLEMTIVAGSGGTLENDFLNSGAEVVKLNRKFPIDLYLASQLRNVIKDRKIDVVHGYQAVDGTHIYLAARGLRNVKKVLSFQGFIPDKRNRVASRLLIPRMDLNIVVSKGLKHWLGEKDRLNTSTFKLLYNGADPERLKPTGRSIRSELKLPDDAHLIGMIGNFYRDPRKDQLTLCKALPDVLQKLGNVHCIFAGRIEDGAEGKMADCFNFCIENSIDDRVHFIGSRSDVPDILSELEIFIFSSLHEGLPVAVSEAMLASVPMIISDIEPLLEASANGKYAEVFPIRDEKTLSEKIVKLLKNKKDRLQLAAIARDFALENFSIDPHMKKLTELYDGLFKATAVETPASPELD